MTEADRQLGSRWFEEVWNKQRREAIAEMMAPDVVLHEGGMDTIGTAAFYRYFDQMRAALSEFQVTVHDTISEGDKICIRWTCVMKHTGDGLGMPATNKTLQVSGLSLIRIAGGKLVEGWQNWDMLAMMEQIQGTGRALTYTGAAAARA